MGSHPYMDVLAVRVVTVDPETNAITGTGPIAMITDDDYKQHEYPKMVRMSNSQALICYTRTHGGDRAEDMSFCNVLTVSGTGETASVAVSQSESAHPNCGPSTCSSNCCNKHCKPMCHFSLNPYDSGGGCCKQWLKTPVSYTHLTLPTICSV